MATEVGSIVYRVDLDKKGFESGVNSVNNSLNSLSDTAGGGALSLGKLSGAFAIGQLAADAFKNVVASISTAVGNSFNALKSLETSRASFEVLTGSAEKASTTISGLAKFASTTPFEFPELAKAAKTLLGFGVSADEVQNRIRQIGDVSAATGGDLSGIATVVGQIFAAGKVNGQDYLQLINNSVALGPEIAKELGIPLSGVKDAIEKGAVTSDVFARALSGATSEGGKFFGGTGKLADTLDGRISTLKDTFTGLVGSIVGVDFTTGLVKADGLFAKISTAVKVLSDNLSKVDLAAFGETIAKVISSVVSFIADNGDIIISVVAGIASAFTFTSAVAGIKNLVAAFNLLKIAALSNPILLAITAVVAAIAFLQMKFNIIGKTIDALKPVFENLSNFITGVFNAIKLLITGDFKGGIFGLEEDSGPVKAFLKIREVAIALGEFIGKQFKQAWDSLVATFNTIKDSFAKLAVAMKPLLDALKAIWERIQGPVLTVLKILGGLILVAIVAPIALAVAAFIVAIVVIAKVVQVIAFLIRKFIEIQTAVSSFVASVVTGFISFVSAIQNAVGSIFGVIVSVFAAIFNFIFTIFTNVFNFIVSIFTAYYTFIFNTLTTIWNTIVNILTAVWNFIVSVFNNVKDFIVNVFNSIKDWIIARFNEIWAFISNIVQSIYNTIVNTFNTIVDSVRSIFTNVVNAIKSAFDGATNFLFDAGKNIIEGLINGIKSVADKVKNIATDIADNIKDKFTSALGINSPSKVFIGYGQNIVQGLANGVKNLSSVVDYEVAKINPSVDVTGAVTAPSSSSTFSNQQPGGVGGKVNNIFIVSNTLKASESELSDLAEQILYSNPKTRGLVA